MQYRHLEKMAAATSSFVIAFAFANVIGLSSARADDPKAMFKQMSDYVTSQKAISFDYDTNLEIVTPENQKLGLASSGAMTLNRPDKLRASRMGGFSDVDIAFDGTKLTVLGKRENIYTEINSPGTVDQLVDEMRSKYHRLVPAADLLLSNPYDKFIPQVEDAKDLGSGVIGGVECDHLAFRTKDVDWQVWIAQGARRYPCRLVITNSKVPGSPEYTVDVRAWKTGDEVAGNNFKIEVPSGAKQVQPVDLKNFDPLGGIYKLKEQ
jgi:hypothetical protein